MLLKMTSCSLLFLCIFILEISIHYCNTIAIRDDTRPFIEPGSCEYRRLVDARKNMDSGFPERRRSTCQHRGDGTICCQYATWSGSCDNCGSRCTGRHSRSYPCCAPCFEIPPTRLPEFIEVKPGSCEFQRLESQWKESVCLEENRVATRCTYKDHTICCNFTSVDGTCGNCGTPCDDAQLPCCGGCKTIPYRTTTTTTTTTTTKKPSRPSSSSTCFPSNAKVNLENGKSVKMSELKIGDQVQTVTLSGRLTCSKVGAFLRIQHKTITLYKSITTSVNNTISLSGNHLIYARKNIMDKFNPIYADEIIIGDEILALQNLEVKTVKVIRMSSFMMKGAYVPLTMEGNIVVDGILASCYASCDHDSAHIGMLPMQLFPTLIKWIFGDDNGSPAYVNIAGNIGGWMLPDYVYFSETK